MVWESVTLSARKPAQLHWSNNSGEVCLKLASLEMERVVPVNVPISVDQLSNTPVRGGLLSEWWCFDCMLHLAFFFTELFENVAFLMVVALSEEPPTLLPWLRPTLLMPTPPQLVMVETKLISVFDSILPCFP